MVLCFDWPRNILFSPHESSNHRVLVGFSLIMYSMKNCVKCSGRTKYVCLKCAKPLCNKSKECSVPADEDSPGREAGVSVAYCVSCSEVPIPNVRTKQAN